MTNRISELRKMLLRESESACDEPFETWLLQPMGGDVLKFKMFPELGFYAGIRRLMYHYTMIFGEIGDRTGYSRRYCYATLEGALAALEAWDGNGDPEGWHRAPETGRRRFDGDASKEYIDW